MILGMLTIDERGQPKWRLLCARVGQVGTQAQGHCNTFGEAARLWML